jgi:hypothetical protein
MPQNAFDLWCAMHAVAASRGLGGDAARLWLLGRRGTPLLCCHPERPVNLGPETPSRLVKHMRRRCMAIFRSGRRGVSRGSVNSQNRLVPVWFSLSRSCAPILSRGLRPALLDHDSPWYKHIYNSLRYGPGLTALGARSGTFALQVPHESP